MAISREKWFAMSKEIRLRHMATELKRAEKASERKEKDMLAGAYERILDMLDATVEDKNWGDKKDIFALRDAIATLYSGENHSALSRFFASSLLKEADTLSS